MSEYITESELQELLSAIRVYHAAIAKASTARVCDVKEMSKIRTAVYQASLHLEAQHNKLKVKYSLKEGDQIEHKTRRIIRVSSA